MSQHADLERFAALLRKWNAVQNLVSRETIDELWPRHIEDCLQLMKFVPTRRSARSRHRQRRRIPGDPDGDCFT